MHAGAEPADAVESGVTPGQLARRTQAAALAAAQAARLPGRDLDALVAAQRQLLAHDVDALLDRISAQRIRALHGGLAPASVAVAKGARVTLGPPRAGAAGDVAADLAALTLALRAAGAERRAEQLAAAYAIAADDFGIYRVLDFCERGLLLALAGQPETAELADVAGAARAVLGRSHGAFVVAVGGAVASGKSTVAKALARELAAPRAEADRVRDALLERGATRAVHEALWARSFAPEFAERVYEGMLARAAHALASGRPVVLDACFPDARRRGAAAALARRRGVPFVFVHCDPPQAAIQARLAKREERDGGVPGGWSALAAELAARWQPPGPEDRAAGEWLRIDTSPPKADWMAALESACSRWRESARAVKE